MERGSAAQADVLDSELVELELESWADFVKEFALSESPNWIFRGHSGFGWSLVSSLQRAFESAGITGVEDRVAMENSTVGFFKERARLRLERPPDEHDLLGWLAVMQHYGAPTRLQDWTQSPFVAAYFAYRDNTAEDAAVWALQAYFCRRNLTPVMLGQPWDHLGVLEASGHDKDGNEVTLFPWTELTPTEVDNEALREAIRGGNGWPLPILPLAYDSRMAAQQAVFLCATRLDFALESLLDKEAWPHAVDPQRIAEATSEQASYKLHDSYQLIKRVRLRAAWRDDALRTLRQMGISEETLFPGLDGSGRAARMHIASRELGLRDALHSLGF